MSNKKISKGQSMELLNQYIVNERISSPIPIGSIYVPSASGLSTQGSIHIHDDMHCNFCIFLIGENGLAYQIFLYIYVR
jgi:hypothetical protein